MQVEVSHIGAALCQSRGCRLSAMRLAGASRVGVGNDTGGPVTTAQHRTVVLRVLGGSGMVGGGGSSEAKRSLSGVGHRHDGAKKK